MYMLMCTLWFKYLNFIILVWRNYLVSAELKFVYYKYELRLSARMSTDSSANPRLARQMRTSYDVSVVN